MAASLLPDWQSTSAVLLRAAPAAHLRLAHARPASRYAGLCFGIEGLQGEHTPFISDHARLEGQRLGWQRVRRCQIARHARLRLRACCQVRTGSTSPLLYCLAGTAGTLQLVHQPARVLQIFSSSFVADILKKIGMSVCVGPTFTVRLVAASWQDPRTH